MSHRTYGQFCGLVRALEVLGERWALLIVRDLFLGPRRFTDLQRGLPRIATNALSARLKELEQAGVIRRRVIPRPQSGVVYELTQYGLDLEDGLWRLGLWGARSLGGPGPEDILTPEALALALRASFRPNAARRLKASYELRIGDVVVQARVDRGSVRTDIGPLDKPDLVLEAGLEVRGLMAAEVSPSEALASGAVKVTGDPELLERFVEAFHITPGPAKAAAGA